MTKKFFGNYTFRMNEVQAHTGRLTKISDNSNALRTNGVVGFFSCEPMVDCYFTLYSESLTPGEEHRVISTSLVTSVDRDGSGIIFRTLYSTYLLEIFEGHLPQ